MTDVIIERMYECLNLFSEPTKAWFEHAFKCPTDTQRQAWPAIRSGGNVLVTAPTGSGKTLCAFLSAIDGLMGSLPQVPSVMVETRRESPSAASGCCTSRL